ncbi:methylmalonyl-CoA mutase metallochaperone MeaB [Salsuginibacillus halophilus]|uniref:Methylmalonyl-CoA mutase metallochaperone MeaB n=1 Tax=Salsuginibacillus halophilus TaxID=517424 RepID=A0A2P8HXK9_9BACI|nr:methylmalonyl Co-A mutase-associated GTPase MeaB [Salsuginibacillus halophilus]PSL50966.1 methylmalonyl-CoA mutase metallochaperone MeaB [Salsuginibacillus halophilus]
MVEKRRKKTAEEHAAGVLAGDRASLAQAITLIESRSAKHWDQAQQVVEEVLPYTGKARRLGFSGVPGAGKSTLIEAFGMMLCEAGYRVAVLAVDPSSTTNRGSILGDKTRMERLSKHPNAFIRPSPSGGTAGGVAKKSRETMFLCEAAGFDVIIVETVGVGQGETLVRSMVDYFLLLVLTGGGDELQGMKKGIMEIADDLYINKADGINKQPALNARAEFNRMLHFLQPSTPGWTTEAHTVSALYHDGLKAMWERIDTFFSKVQESGRLTERRRHQMSDWMKAMVQEELERTFYQNPGVQSAWPAFEASVISGKTAPARAVQQLLQQFWEDK